MMLMVRKKDLLRLVEQLSQKNMSVKFDDALKYVLEKLQEEFKELAEEIEFYENLKRDDCPTSDDPYW